MGGRFFLALIVLLAHTGPTLPTVAGLAEVEAFFILLYGSSNGEVIAGAYRQVASCADIPKTKNNTRRE